MDGEVPILDDLNIAVVGLGYVGLPTALAMHQAGYSVSGIDISKNVIDTLREGKSPLIDNTANEVIPINSERWKVTSNFRDGLDNVDVVLITVPTPTNPDNSPDLSYIISASESILENLHKEKKVILVLESTVYPGVTREILGKTCQSYGFEINKNIFLAYCPERVNPGDTSKGVTSVAQIVGCDNPKIGDFLVQMFSTTTDAGATYVGKMEVAEASKMIENVQRDVDIALVNELAIVLPKLGIDVQDVLKAASTKWNFHNHTPGIGVGGHCIPVDPYYYISISEKIGMRSKISTAAREINSKMPSIAALDIKRMMRNISNPQVLILGYSYKPELGDTRETPVRELAYNLIQNGIKIKVWDPVVLKENVPNEFNAIDNPYEFDNVDMILIATGHKEIINLDWNKMKNLCKSRIIFDGRRVLDKTIMENNGWTYTGIGVPLV